MDNTNYKKNAIIFLLTYVESSLGGITTYQCPVCDCVVAASINGHLSPHGQKLKDRGYCFYCHSDILEKRNMREWQ